MIVLGLINKLLFTIVTRSHQLVLRQEILQDQIYEKSWMNLQQQMIIQKEIARSNKFNIYMITRLRSMNIGGKGCCLKNLNNLISLNNCGTYSIQIIDHHQCTVIKEIKTEIKIIDYQFSQNGLFLVLNGGHMITIINLISNFYRRLYNTEFVGLINNHILYIQDSYLKIEHNGVLTTSFKVYKWSRFYCLKNIYAQSLEPMRDIQFKAFKNKNIKFIYNGKTGYNILQTSQSNQFIINDVKLKRFTHIVKLRTIKQIRIIKYQQYYEEKDLTQFQVYNNYIVYPLFKFKLNLFNFISLKKESQVIFVKGKYVIQNNLKNLICLHQTVPKLSVYEIKWN